MSTLFDVFAYLSVLLRGLDLIAQSILLGGVSFLLFIAAPIRKGAESAISGTERIVSAAAAATAVTAIAGTLVSAAVLASLLDVSWLDVADTHFAIAGSARAAAAAVIGLMASRGAIAAPWQRAVMIVLAASVLVAAIVTTHAMARAEDTSLLVLATAAHELGAGLWLGALPSFLSALSQAPSALAARIGRRFSTLAMIGVALITVSAAIFAFHYIGSVDAVYGTTYGMMSAVKTTLLAMLLALGYANFRVLHRAEVDRRALRRVRRFVEVEMGIGAAVLMAAASITSLPPAVDVVDNRVTWGEIVERWSLSAPILITPDHSVLAIPALQARLDDNARREKASARAPAFVPGSDALPPRNAYDVAWSEYNHHWAGLAVVLMGLAALAQRSGRAPWTRHWPLLFIALGMFLLLRADPEVWPMGDVGIFESLKNPEVLQHRFFALLIVAFALFEWRVRTGRIRSSAPARVFPLMTAIGGTLLLTHSHALGNVKEELLVESTHLPIAVLGIVAGWARWIEIDAVDRRSGRAGWLWPLCFVLIGLLLLAYREA